MKEREIDIEEVGIAGNLQVYMNHIHAFLLPHCDKKRGLFLRRPLCFSLLWILFPIAFYQGPQALIIPSLPLSLSLMFLQPLFLAGCHQHLFKLTYDLPTIRKPFLNVKQNSPTFLTLPFQIQVLKKNYLHFPFLIYSLFHSNQVFTLLIH